MNKERKIEVYLTPNTGDNKYKPYFWVIMEYSGENWCNSGMCGWAETPQKAWEEAIESDNFCEN